MRILLLKPPIFNVGDGFVAKGAKALLESLSNDVEVIESSAFSYRMARWAGGHSDKWLEQTTGIGELVDVDIAVLPGCTLFRGAMLEHSKIFQQLVDRDVPIILLGTGGLNYTEDEISNVRGYIEGTIDGLISRNPKAYDAYADSVRYAYRGIDCAFFVDSWCNPPESNREFVASTFLSPEEPEISVDCDVVRPHHEPFFLLPQTELFELSRHSKLANRLNDLYHWTNDSSLDIVNKIPVLNQLDANFPGRNLQKSVIEEFRQGDVFMSGELSEYLFIYANATETHTERVHATIPSLVYGTPVKFYLETPRAGVFENIVEEDSDGYWTAPDDVLEDLRNEQRRNLERLIREVTS